ncbi:MULTISPECIES: response regulator transcription factor [Lysinibacillus]|jgi:two-component system competent response regulator ComA|uniref:Two component transcriptional regulator, LuxR family n=3 Tax=Bacillaceae TaxID=186817 RepID=A0A1H9EV05_9BACI|nr:MULTISPECIES: response regulator transcription factor [Lysinibacillus]AXQ50713.1 DNA-binding response regulator [Stenotrophomonas rhizophila]EAZ86605.1 two-component response regulator [Bacillus sp. B14905]AJK86146.1 regulator [Lysinibacillus fusiformis]KAB0445496.1 DNA-binding response regulator [Lysinibacillus fusiformis]KEK11292.1 regulator [Lysinibacillus sphaericus]
MITMLIVDDHPIVLEGTKNLFHENEDIIIDTESDATCVIQRIKNKPYAIYLIDINMPLENGINLARHIKSIQSDASVILYTGDDITDYYPLILERKIEGILAKTASKEQIIRTVRAIANGEFVLPKNFLDFLDDKFKLQSAKDIHLNEKEKKILRLIAEGHTNKAIAIELNIPQRTTERYLTQLFSLLNVDSRTEAVNLAERMNLL